MFFSYFLVFCVGVCCGVSLVVYRIGRINKETRYESQEDIR